MKIKIKIMKDNLGEKKSSESSGKYRIYAKRSSDDRDDEEKKLKKTIYETAAGLHERISERLGDIKKQDEFLVSLYKYMIKEVDLTEFLNMVDDSIRADEKLMNDLDHFLEDCEITDKDWSPKPKRAKVCN